VNLNNTANINGIMPTDTVAVEPKQSTNEVKLFEVSVTAEVQLSLTGRVNVYATDADEAIEKVQGQIDTEALDDDLDMEDFESGYTMPYSDVKNVYEVAFQVDGVEVVEDDVDPADVLEVEIENLLASISWNPFALAKHKAFLESLLNEGDDEQAVAA
jgi:hypothetical protein